MTRHPWQHDRDCLYVVTDGPAPCTCPAGLAYERYTIFDKDVAPPNPVDSPRAGELSAGTRVTVTDPESQQTPRK